MCYELEQRTEYPRSIRDDIRREITQARTFAELANPLLPAPAKYTSQIETLLGRIAYHQQHYAAPPPYAEALLHLQRRLEAARRGEAAPTPPPPEPGTSALAALGRPAPEFVIPDFTSPQSAGLHRWKGKPILMVFYNPKSILVEEVLQLAQEVQNAGRGEVAVLALAMSQDAEAVRQQRANLHLSVPVLNGTGLRQSYGVEATPKLMVVDDRGILRGSYVGWGQETRTAVMADLKPWLLRKSSLPR
jgi:peroxiredoxin